MAERLRHRPPGTALAFPGRFSALNICGGADTNVSPSQHGLLKHVAYSVSARAPLSHLPVTTSRQVLPVGRHTEEP